MIQEEIRIMRRKLLLGMLALSLMCAGGNGAVCAEDLQTPVVTGNDDETEIKAGWHTEEGRIYYYSDGKRVTGWKKIDGKSYYFDKTKSNRGALLRNTIVGTKKSGYYYVDAQGVRVTDKTTKAVVAFVMRNTKTGSSRSKKLQQSFQALCRQGRYARAYDKPSASKMPGYAKEMLTKKQGNCYRHASAVAYFARVLGYESRVAVGKIRTSNGLSAHGWAEIKKGGKWYRCDATFWKNNPSAQYYMADANSALQKYQCSARYKLTAGKGKLSWKKMK